MSLNKVILVLLGSMFLSGCGDQFWCGEDGCNAGSSKTLFKSSEKV